MSASEMPRQLLGTRGLERLQKELSGRDLAIANQVAELRLLSAEQLRAIHFPLGEHDTPTAAVRASQRALSRLVEERILFRLQRRVGGVRAGSASYIYALGPVGSRLVTSGRSRRRYYEPTVRFVDHTLAIAQLVVDITVASRNKTIDVLQLQPEPRCYRNWSGLHGNTVLKPDMFVALGVDELEYRWFVEMDLSTESTPVILRKCRQYESYYQTGKEQAAHHVFPTVCWITPDKQRAQRIHDEITRDGHLTDQLFTVTTIDKALDVLKGGAL